MTRQEKESFGEKKAFIDFTKFLDFVEDKNHTVRYVIITHYSKSIYSKRSYISVHYKDDRCKSYHLIDVWQDIESDARFYKVSTMVEKYCRINNIKIK